MSSLTKTLPLPADAGTSPRSLTTSTASSTSAASAPSSVAGSRITLRRLMAAEWLKFRTVRSNLVALGGATAAAVGFGMLFASLADSGQGPERLATDSLSLSLGGFYLAQLVIAILGVALVAGEYQTGLIRSWFAAAPNRLSVLAAKVTVFTSAVLVIGAVGVTVAFAAAQAVLPGSVPALAFDDPGVLQALAGTTVYTAAVAAMGVGLGFLLRSTAAGTGAIVSLLMLAPVLINLLPSSIAEPLGKVLPSGAGDAITGTANPGVEVLSAGWGLVVLGLWVTAVLGSAAVAVHRRDA